MKKLEEMISEMVDQGYYSCFQHSQAITELCKFSEIDCQAYFGYTWESLVRIITHPNKDTWKMIQAGKP